MLKNLRKAVGAALFAAIGRDEEEALACRECGWHFGLRNQI